MDDIWMDEHETHIYDKMGGAYMRWHEEEPEEFGVWKEGKGMEPQLWSTCAVCKILQQQTRLWM